MLAQIRLAQIGPQRLPNLLRNKRHEWMQYPQHPVETMGQHITHGRLPLAACLERVLRKLDIPVTELVPDELVDDHRCVVEFIRVDRRRYFADGLVEPAQYPSL